MGAYLHEFVGFPRVTMPDSTAAFSAVVPSARVSASTHSSRTVRSPATASAAQNLRIVRARGTRGGGEVLDGHELVRGVSTANVALGLGIVLLGTPAYYVWRARTATPAAGFSGGREHSAERDAQPLP